MRTPLDLSAVRSGLCGGGTAWTRIESHDRVGSTNTLAREDPVPWRVVLADVQDSGRGRLARRWEAPTMSSIAVSVVLPLPERTSAWGWQPLLVGVAMCDALRSVGLCSARLKWPNDVVAALVDGAAAGTAGGVAELAADDAAGMAKIAEDAEGKVCGVLCESLPAAAGPVAVAGAGVNVDQYAGELPVPTAASLRTLGYPGVPREQVVAAYLNGLARLQARWLAGGFEAGLRQAYLERCSTLGRVMRISTGSGLPHAGRAVDVDAQGRLVLRQDGIDRAFAAGDVDHVRPGSDQADDRG